MLTANEKLSAELLSKDRGSLLHDIVRIVHHPAFLFGCLIVFAPLIDGGTTQLPVLIIRLLILGSLLAWAVHSIRGGRFSVGWNGVLSVGALFIGWSALSFLWTPYKVVSLQWGISLFLYGGFLFLLLQRVTSVTQLHRLAMVIVGMGLMEGVVSIIQFVFWGYPRGTGTFFNPNFLASYEVVTLVIALGMLSDGRRAGKIAGETCALYMAVAAALGSLLAAQSRGAVLAGLIAAGFVGFVRFRKRFAFFLAAVVVAGILIPNPIMKRAIEVSAHDPYAYTRLDMWANAIQRLVDHPWGVGLGMFKYASFEYRFPVDGGVTRYGKRAESAHNEYLQIAVELGVVGLAIFVFGIARWAMEAKVLLSADLPQDERGLVTGLIGGVLGLLVHSAIDSVLHEPALVVLLIMCGGMVLVMIRIKCPERSRVWTIPVQAHPVRTGILIALALVVGVVIVQPAAAWYAHLQGQRAEQARRAGQALEWFQRAVAIEAGTTAYHDDLARISVAMFHQSGDSRWLNRAMEELAACIALNPRDGRFPYRAGILALLVTDKTGSTEEREFWRNQAVTYFEEAIRRDPYSPFTYVELGKLRWSQGQREEARQWMARAISYEPNFLPARMLLAEYALEVGNRSEALSEYANMLDVKERFLGRELNAVERQYLDVRLDQLTKVLKPEQPQ